MATRKFTLNTTPHEAEIGDTVLKFVPEVAADEFLDGYARLREAQKTANSLSGDEDLGDVRKVTSALREFLTDLMLPESREPFSAMVLPVRVLVELTEWVAEIYGSGASDRPTGRPGGSASSRQTPGTRSKAN